jgi:hypothetical protein
MDNRFVMDGPFHTSQTWQQSVDIPLPKTKNNGLMLPHPLLLRGLSSSYQRRLHLHLICQLSNLLPDSAPAICVQSRHLLAERLGFGTGNTNKLVFGGRGALQGPLASCSPMVIFLFPAVRPSLVVGVSLSCPFSFVSSFLSPSPFPFPVPHITCLSRVQGSPG